jgi:hypothetical protein
MPDYPKGNQLHPDDNLPSGNPTADREYYRTVVDNGAPFDSGGAFIRDQPIEYVRDSMFVRKPSARGEVSNDIGTDRSELNRSRYLKG